MDEFARQVYLELVYRNLLLGANPEPESLGH